MNFLVFTSIPFESESVPESDMINKNLFINNVGNLFFTNAVYNTLNSPNNKIVRYHSGVSVKDFDAGILIHANDIRNGLSGVLDRESELMDKFKIPFIMMSIGTDSDPFFKTGLNDEIINSTKRLFSKILDRTPTIGVRGEHTKRIIVKYCKIPSDSIEVIGCPSVRYFGKNLKKFERPFKEFSSDIKISVNFTAYHYDIDEAIYLYKILKNFKNSYVIFTDKVEADLLFNHVPVPENRNHELLPTNYNHFILKNGRARFSASQNKIMGMLRTFDFTIGSRIHQAIISIISGTPALLIAHSTRVLEIAKYHKIPYILRSELIERSPSVEELYYMACAKMVDFYSSYDVGLHDYSKYLKNNGLMISSNFDV